MLLYVQGEKEKRKEERDGGYKSRSFALRAQGFFGFSCRYTFVLSFPKYVYPASSVVQRLCSYLQNLHFLFVARKTRMLS